MSTVVLALLAAAFFAGTSVLQHRATTRSGAAEGLSALRLVLVVLRSPLWLVSLLLGAVGFGLQALALAGGQVVVVQPLLATGLVFGLLLGAVSGHPPTRTQWTAAAGTVAGLALFLLAASPAAGTDRARGPVLAVATAVTLVLLTLARVVTLRPGGRHAAAVLAGAAGVGFGMTGPLLKQAVTLLAASPGELLTDWSLYALVVVGGASIALAQAAFAAGSLVDCLPALALLEPLAAAAVGSVAFAEVLRASPAARVGEVVGVVVAAVSVLRLARLEAVTVERAEDWQAGAVDPAQGGTSA